MRTPLVLTMRCCVLMLCAAAIAGCGGSGRDTAVDGSAVTLDVVGSVGSDTVAPFIYFANLEQPQDGFDAAFCDGLVSPDQLAALAARVDALPPVDRAADFLLASVDDGRHRYVGTIADESATVWLTLDAGDDFPCIADVEVEPESFAPLFDPLSNGA